MATAGKRAGSRRGAKQRTRPSRTAILQCLGITVCVVAWGYLVFAAIDFGSTAREGDNRAWGFLALACAGAAACLFAGLILGAKVLRQVGILAPLALPEESAPAMPGFGSAPTPATDSTPGPALAPRDHVLDPDADPAPTATIPAQHDAPTATIPAQPDAPASGSARAPRYQGKRVAR